MIVKKILEIKKELEKKIENEDLWKDYHRSTFIKYHIFGLTFSKLDLENYSSNDESICYFDEYIVEEYEEKYGSFEESVGISYLEEQKSNLCEKKEVGVTYIRSDGAYVTLTFDKNKLMGGNEN